MGYVTIKPDPDKDLYVIFSSISDSPVCWGPAEQMLKWAIKDEFSNKYDRVGVFGDKYYRALERADVSGTSSLGWTDSWENENPGINWNGDGMMPFSNLEKALDLLEADEEVDSEKVLALVDKFEWDDE